MHQYLSHAWIDELISLGKRLGERLGLLAWVIPASLVHETVMPVAIFWKLIPVCCTDAVPDR